ncbi:hypothetical protein Droror1_Dr00023991, partial [Drosera rotundifolia]
MTKKVVQRPPKQARRKLVLATSEEAEEATLNWPQMKETLEEKEVTRPLRESAAQDTIVD